ncbi:MAG: GNAT family N-acetyltransferase [Syntrophorhabdales bacterium]|jgi:ribosomal protein S18 acetylase RimI-like enzyme
MGRTRSIRKITAGDIPTIIDIQESITKERVSQAWARGMEGHVLRREVVGFVAVKGGKVVGYITGEIKGPGFGIEMSGWIEFIGVYPRFMGEGIGKTLARKLFDCFKKNHVEHVYTAARWDAVDILSFLKSIGFDRSPLIYLEKDL